jgi:hypothetical protein
MKDRFLKSLKSINWNKVVDWTEKIGKAVDALAKLVKLVLSFF